MTGTRVGFYGKLPSRGDFLRVALSRDVASAWDDWVGSVLPPARRSLGPRWSEAWRAGRIWHLALAAGLCGPRPVTGFWLPSVDAVGRAFPLLVAVEAAMSPASFAALGALAADAVGQALEPDVLAAHLSEAFKSEPTPSGTIDHALWWTRTAGRPLRMFSIPSMPTPDCFLEMLLS